jgi:hydroxymethylbilane synthase
MKGRIIIGSRKSKLALFQAQEVIDALRAVYPRLSFEITTVKTVGDRDRKTSLKVLGGKGIFVKELEEALLRREIDIAVHSLKDMPTDIPAGLKLAAVTRRMDPRDVLVSASGVGLSKLPPGSSIGTGSQRRTVQLMNCRRDITVTDMRGNIDTRLRKCYCGEVDSVLMAAAALLRMKLEDRVTEYLATDEFVPAVGQGALGIEVLDGDELIQEIIAPLNHEQSWREVSAERAFLKALGGGCREPIAALAVAKGTSLRIRGMVANSATFEVMYADMKGGSSEAEQLGVRLAQKMMEMGAGRLIGRSG